MFVFQDLQKPEIKPRQSCLYPLPYYHGNNLSNVKQDRNMSAKCGARENVNFKTEDKSKSPKNVYLIAQDIKFAKVLACNNKKLRDRALKSLKKWFQHRSTKLRKFTRFALHISASNCSLRCSIHRRRLHENMERLVLLHVDVR